MSRDEQQRACAALRLEQMSGVSAAGTGGGSCERTLLAGTEFSRPAGGLQEAELW